VNRVSEALVDGRLEISAVPAVDEAVDAVFQRHFDVPVGHFRRAFVVPADGRTLLRPRLDPFPPPVRALLPERAVVHEADVVGLGRLRCRHVAGLGQTGARFNRQRQILHAGCSAFGGDRHAHGVGAGPRGPDAPGRQVEIIHAQPRDTTLRAADERDFLGNLQARDDVFGLAADVLDAGHHALLAPGPQLGAARGERADVEDGRADRPVRQGQAANRHRSGRAGEAHRQTA